MNMVDTDVDNIAQLWKKIRSSECQGLAEEIIRLSSPFNDSPLIVSHVRTAHYAAFKVESSSNHSWLVRVGVSSDTDQRPTDNSGPFGTSSFSPTGQYREAQLSKAFEDSQADVIAASHYAQVGQFDVMWSPFILGSNEVVSANQWYRALTSLYGYSPDVELPVFTNRAKTFQRLSEFRDEELATSLQKQYDSKLGELFKVSSKWSVIHGDAHGGNALISDGKALLFDFDTTCWAPSVWDLTHLLNRAGAGVDSGYTAKELASLFNFTSEEIDAGLTLRKIASTIAKKHREQSYVYEEPNERENDDRPGALDLLVA